MQEIALFPLNIFLLPGDFTQLYIFEERYKQLINECEQSGRPFGIPFSNKLNTANYGCLVELVEIVNRHEDGELDVVLKAVGLFKLQQFFYQHDEKLYPGGRVKVENTPAETKAPKELASRFKDYLIKHEIFNSDLLAEDNLTLFEIANALQMNDLEKLDLVRLGEQAAIEKFLVNYIRYLELLHEQESHVYENIYLN